MSLTVTSTAINFDNLNRAIQSVTVTGGLPPYTASSSNTNVATVAQGISPNLYPNSDSLSGSTLSGLTPASGGPGGATDAEYTGTGSAVGSNPYLSHVISVTPGQSYVASFWIDPSQVTNNTGSQMRVAISQADGIRDCLSVALPAGSLTAGRYATSAWTCPTNLAPHSDDLSTWTRSANMALGTGGPGSATDFEYTGTGSPSGNEYAFSSAVTVVPGTTYTFSDWIDPSHITGATYPQMLIQNTAGSTTYATFTLSSTTTQRYALTGWTCPVGVTQIRLLLDSNGVTVASGQKLKFSQPMLEPKSSASGYYISSQNPQVQVFAQLLSSAIVTSGQKFKISQPMLALSTYDPNVYLSPTAVWNISPKNGGAATITYTDSTP